MRVFSATDVGQRRTQNQDFVFASESPVGNLPNLFLVADGMGGHNAGDFASSYSVKVIEETVAEDRDYNPVKVLRHAIRKANEELRVAALRDPDREGMGTTIVAVTIAGHYAYVANVGDSRLYVINTGIKQVTSDHSLVAEMVKMGEISAEEAKFHPDKNIITRALGAEEEVNVDFFEIDLEMGSILLMCSDGLSNMVMDHEMEEIVLTPMMSLEDRGNALIARANTNGGKDNIAVVLIDPFTDEVEKC